MSINAYSARLDEIARQEDRASAPRKPLDVTLPELALATIAALLLSLICC